MGTPVTSYLVLVNELSRDGTLSRAPVIIGLMSVPKPPAYPTPYDPRQSISTCRGLGTLPPVATGALAATASRLALCRGEESASPAARCQMVYILKHPDSHAGVGAPSSIFALPFALPSKHYSETIY